MKATFELKGVEGFKRLEEKNKINAKNIRRYYQ